jgi:hypothetical protein
MRYDLANGRNASRRRGQLLPGCAVALRVGGRVWVGGDGDMHSMLRSGLTWDEKDRLLPTVAVADDNVHCVPCSGLICGREGSR